MVTAKPKKPKMKEALSVDLVPSKADRFYYVLLWTDRDHVLPQGQVYYNQKDATDRKLSLDSIDRLRPGSVLHEARIVTVRAPNL